MNGATTHLWVYKDQINPVAELYPSGVVKYHFTYAEQGHVPSLMRHYDEAGNLLNTYRYITDHLGSVLMLIDIETNAIVQAIEYDAWGNVLSDSNPGFQPFYYAGGVYDQITKLTKFGYRDYQAETGRFIQSDPIGLSGGVNIYLYTGASPLNFIDVYELTQADINEALSIAKQMRPDWSFPSEVQTWSEPGKGGKTVRGLFDLGTPKIYLDNKYAECLSIGDKAQLWSCTPAAM